MHPMRLAAAVDLVRIAVMRYTATLLQGDAEDAKPTVTDTLATTAEAEAEIDAVREPKLKALVLALKAKLVADSAALADVIKAADDLRTIQGDLLKASAAIDDQTSKINGCRTGRPRKKPRRRCSICGPGHRPLPRTGSGPHWPG